jgi:hypothetical protein
MAGHATAPLIAAESIPAELAPVAAELAVGEAAPGANSTAGKVSKMAAAKMTKVATAEATKVATAEVAEVTSPEVTSPEVTSPEVTSPEVTSPEVGATKMSSAATEVTTTATEAPGSHLVGRKTERPQRDGNHQCTSKCGLHGSLQTVAHQRGKR